MSPEIFIEEFERTENSDYLHGVLGRSLIIATRFDSLCNSLSLTLEIKQAFTSLSFSEENFDLFTRQLISKYRTLDNSIKSFCLPDELSEILHVARKARNEVVHSLTRGLDGCLDTKISNDKFIEEISSLMEILVTGGIVISSLISVFNNEPILSRDSLVKYRKKVLIWVTMR